MRGNCLPFGIPKEHAEHQTVEEMQTRKGGFVKIKPTDFYEGMIPFYFFQSKGRAYVYAGLYENRGDASRAAYDVNKITGKLTCMLSKRLPCLKIVSESCVIVTKVSDARAFGA